MGISKSVLKKLHSLLLVFLLCRIYISCILYYLRLHCECDLWAQFFVCCISPSISQMDVLYSWCITFAIVLFCACVCGVCV
uniref:Uncharacterized protein n=1 Tax=Amblyomma tuberculatum TaxID=48802 RepID=A0A6M2E4M8_9ACAR